MKKDGGKFTVKAQRAAYKRANGRCEAVGSIYGLPEGKRCSSFISYYSVQVGIDGEGQCIAICPWCKKYAEVHHP